MKLGKVTALLGLICCLLMTAPLADAARPLRPQGAARGGGITGTVVGLKNHPVAGARVHIVHPHHAKPANGVAGNAVAGKVKGKPAAAHPGALHAHAHHGTVTAADGSFSLRHGRSGTVMVEAHKKGEGSGRARATVSAGGTSGVVIHLHKHHRHHS